VAGVVPTLETRHRRGTLGEQIDDLALAFIAPLVPMMTTKLPHGA